MGLHLVRPGGAKEHPRCERGRGALLMCPALGTAHSEGAVHVEMGASPDWVSISVNAPHGPRLTIRFCPFCGQNLREVAHVQAPTTPAG